MNRGAVAAAPLAEDIRSLKGASGSLMVALVANIEERSTDPMSI
jgi:hypothetical protein